MAENEKRGEYSTQRVDLETVDMIKTINLHLARRGVKLRQSDLIRLAFLFIKSREVEFLEFAEAGTAKNEGLLSTVFKVTSKPWFPYGDLSG